jgi:hypothetical protein
MHGIQGIKKKEIKVLIPGAKNSTTAPNILHLGGNHAQKAACLRPFSFEASNARFPILFFLCTTQTCCCMISSGCFMTSRYTMVVFVLWGGGHVTSEEIRKVR